DTDDGNAGRLFAVAQHAGNIGTEPGQRRQHLLAERIGADAADHRHVVAKTGGRGGLVGALAAEAERVAVAMNRFAWLRQPRAVGNDIEIETADDDDAHGPFPVSRAIMRSRNFAQSTPVSTR